MITPLPTPPSRVDPANFADRADTFLGQLPTFATEANDLATDVMTDANAAALAANAANVSKTLAESAASTAATAAGAAQWVSGATYSTGNAAYSSLTGLVYRKITASSVTTVDPSQDNVNWVQINTGWPIVVETALAAFTTPAYRHVIMTNAATCTLTLPSSPKVNDVVFVTFTNGRIDNVIARNTQNIMALAENMTVNIAGTVQLIFVNSTIGWRIV